MTEISASVGGKPAAARPGAMPTGAGLLDRILAPANLAAAWEMVAANEGMPGVDRMRISQFARRWEERVMQLAADVRANRYTPSRLRTRFIPKRDGGRRREAVCQPGSDLTRVIECFRHFRAGRHAR